MISVIGFENQNNVIYYQVQYEDKVLQKRFSQFEELHQQLLSYFPLPNLPPKTYVTVILGKSLEQLEKRQKGLDIYLKELHKNPRIVKSYHFRSFLGLAQQVQMIHEFEIVSLPIKDFTIDFDKGVMLVLGSEKMSIPSIFNKVNQNQIVFGILECWLQKEEIFKKEWIHQFQKSTTCFHYQDDKVVIGFVDSSIILILLNQNYEIASQKEFQHHNSKIQGVHILNECIHSICDNEYKVFAMNKNEFIFQQTMKEIEGFLFNQDKTYIYDKIGNILVFDNQNQKIQQLLKIETQIENIKGIHQTNNNKLICVGNLGNICLIETNTYTIIQKGKTKTQSQQVSYSDSRGLIFIGNKDGTITCLDNEDFSPTIIMNAHINSVSKIRNFEIENLVLTSGEDKFIRAWRLPNIDQIQKLQ